MVMTQQEKPVHTSRRSAAIVTQIESAVRAVRILLGVLASCVLVADRPFNQSPNWVQLAILVTATIVGVLMLNVLSVHTQRRWPQSVAWRTFGQFLDVAAMVGLAVALDSPLQGQSYVLLVIPVVSGSVRHGSASAMLSWAAGCGAYAGLALGQIIGGPADFNFLIRTSGILLVIAATVGILARWMREGWEIQNEMTNAAAIREKRLSTIESAARAMARLQADEAIAVCVDHALQLPFAAASHKTHSALTPDFVLGRSELVSSLDSVEHLTPGQIVLTKWMKKGSTTVYSASVLEPQTDAVISGWSPEVIDEDQAEALAMLVAQTSTAVETTTLLTKLRSQAAQDALTGLPNRRAFEEALDHHAKTDTRLGVAFVDVDYFKQVNDRYGHAVGDNVLAIIAKRLQSAVRPEDVVARIGGDEFVVLLRNTDPDGCMAVGHQIATSMQEPIVTAGTSLYITLSIGFALGVAPLIPADLLGSADRALYKAKDAGRNRVVYSLMDQSDGGASAPEVAEPIGLVAR